MYLIWRMDTTAKGAKKNTSPNVIHLQYFDSVKSTQEYDELIENLILGVSTYRDNWVLIGRYFSNSNEVESWNLEDFWTTIT